MEHGKNVPVLWGALTAIGKNGGSQGIAAVSWRI